MIYKTPTGMQLARSMYSGGLDTVNDPERDFRIIFLAACIDNEADQNVNPYVIDAEIRAEIPQHPMRSHERIVQGWVRTIFPEIKI